MNSELETLLQDSKPCIERLLDFKFDMFHQIRKPRAIPFFKTNWGYFRIDKYNRCYILSWWRSVSRTEVNQTEEWINFKITVDSQLEIMEIRENDFGYDMSYWERHAPRVNTEMAIRILKQLDLVDLYLYHDRRRYTTE